MCCIKCLGHLKIFFEFGLIREMKFKIGIWKFVNPAGYDWGLLRD